MSIYMCENKTWLSYVNSSLVPDNVIELLSVILPIVPSSYPLHMGVTGETGRVPIPDERGMATIPRGYEQAGGPISADDPK